MRIIIARTLLLSLLNIFLEFVSLSQVEAFCPPPFAKIDFISSHDKCLDINDRTKFCGGSIEIINKCSKDYFLNQTKLLKQGSSLYPPVPEKSWTLTLTTSDKIETVIIRGTSTAENFNVTPYSDADSKRNIFSPINIGALGIVAIVLLGFFKGIWLKRKSN